MRREIVSYLEQTQNYSLVPCLRWKWRKRSSVKITQRTHEETREALHAGREGRHSRRHLVDGVPIVDLETGYFRLADQD